MVTIDQALEAFVEDQRQRLSARTMRGYDDVVELLRHSLNGYGPNGLDQAEHRRWEKGDDQHRNRNARLALSVQVSMGTSGAWVLLSGGIRASGHGIEQDHVGVRGSRPGA
jgi:Mg-chelatase subunit ChlI